MSPASLQHVSSSPSRKSPRTPPQGPTRTPYNSTKRRPSHEAANTKCKESPCRRERERWCREKHHRRCVPPSSAPSFPTSIPVNLAFSLSHLQNPSTSSRLRVGILDLDIFGPSVPTLMGLQDCGEPELTSSAQFIPFPLRLSRADHVPTRGCTPPSRKPRPSIHVYGIPPTSLTRLGF